MNPFSIEHYEEEYGVEDDEEAGEEDWLCAGHSMTITGSRHDSHDHSYRDNTDSDTYNHPKYNHQQQQYLDGWIAGMIGLFGFRMGHQQRQQSLPPPYHQQPNYGETPPSYHSSNYYSSDLDGIRRIPQRTTGRKQHWNDKSQGTRSIQGVIYYGGLLILFMVVIVMMIRSRGIDPGSATATPNTTTKITPTVETTKNQSSVATPPLIPTSTPGTSSTLAPPPPPPSMKGDPSSASSSNDDDDKDSNSQHRREIQLVLLGERNSGVAWTVERLRECYPTVNITRGFQRDSFWFQDENVFDNTNNNNNNSKDGSSSSPPTRRSRRRMTSTGTASIAGDNSHHDVNILIIVLVRDPYEWLVQMLNNPIHMPSHARMSMEQFLVAPWTIVPVANTNTGTVDNTNAHNKDNNPRRFLPKKVSLSTSSIHPTTHSTTGMIQTRRKNRSTIESGTSITTASSSNTTNNDQNNNTKGTSKPILCQLGFHEDQVIPCHVSDPDAYDTPIYELQQRGPNRGKPFPTIAALRAAKLQHFLNEVPYWYRDQLISLSIDPQTTTSSGSTSNPPLGFMTNSTIPGKQSPIIFRYEDSLFANLQKLEAVTHWRRECQGPDVKAPTIPVTPGTKRPPHYIAWVNAVIQWELEALLGYEKQAPEP